MPYFSTTTLALHAALLQRLAAAGCRTGRFDVGVPGAHLSFSGQNAAGRTLFFWEFDRSFRRLVSDWLAEAGNDQITQLTIQVDVAAGTCTHTTRPQAADAQRAEKQHIVAAPRDRTPYGPALAIQVAERLDQGAALAYSHRDYCGLGLTRTSEGQYRYATVYDGDFDLPEQEFSSRPAFEQWLAAQSDHSLAGLDSPDPWVWDNQRLTRQRLLEFVRSARK